jgi:ligand-binding sensor domain-containing protein
MTKARQRRKLHAMVFDILLTCLLVLVSSTQAFALDPSLDFSQYAHVSWKTRDGFFRGRINTIAQTTDGLMWLGTEFGLLRFDGVRTIAFQPPGQPLPSNEVWALLGGRDGTLWIGTANGLAAWKDGKLRTYPELSGLYAFVIFEDLAGTVWVSGLGNRGKLCAIEKDKIQCRGEDGSLGHGVLRIYEDSKSRLWISALNGLWRWKPDPMFFPMPGALDGIRGISEGEDGTILLGTIPGLQRFIDGKIEPYSLPGNFQVQRTESFFRDRSGSLWVGTDNNGIVRIHQERAHTFTKTDGLSGDSVAQVFEDHEGNIWVVTDAGLDRFRDVPVATITPKQGLAGQQTGPILAARDGSVWFGTNAGPEKWKNGELTLYHKPGSPSSSLFRSPSVREVQVPGLPTNGTLAMYEDDRGRIWVGTAGGVAYFDDGRFVPVEGVPGGVLHTIVELNTGDFWIDHQDEGLFHVVADKVVEQIPWTKLHVSSPSSMISDRTRGGLWLGLREGGVRYYADHQIRKSYGTAGGLGKGRVNHLRLDQEGTVWASTEGGLSRLEKGRIATLGAKNGLPCDTVHWSIEDDEKSVWMYMSCGLVRIGQQAWNEWVNAANTGNDAKWTIKATIFDNSDGIRITSSLGSFSPRVAGATDGRLWFSNADGINVVDPRHLRFNTIPPPVRIEQITADRKRFDAEFQAGSLSLSPRIRDLQIDYTAYTFVAPEKVRFRYKLEPHDRDWQDVGNRRQAFYTDLPPGNYKFRVIAANDSGAWNETGASFDFSVPAAYYQTIWFRLLIGAIVLGAIGGLYRFRLRHVAKAFEARLEERTRIAQDLHDTLLQGCLSASMQLDIALDHVPDDLPIKPKLTHLQQLLAKVVNEGRDALRGLRAVDPASLDLEQALQRAQQEVAQGDVDFRVIVEGRKRPLHPLIRDEVYRIGREAIVNAYRHANAQHIEVEIDYQPKQLRLFVRDDGDGIDSSVVGASRDGHFGLSGMRERAERIGARVRVSSRITAGTEIDLSVPGKIAFDGKVGRKARVLNNER